MRSEYTGHLLSKHQRTTARAMVMDSYATGYKGVGSGWRRSTPSLMAG